MSLYLYYLALSIRVSVYRSLSVSVYPYIYLARSIYMHVHMCMYVCISVYLGTLSMQTKTAENVSVETAGYCVSPCP